MTLTPTQAPTGPYLWNPTPSLNIAVYGLPGPQEEQ